MQVIDEMVTDSHTKMEFVEFLQALGIVAEMRVLNARKLVRRAALTSAIGKARSAVVLDADAVAAATESARSDPGSDRQDSESIIGQMSTPGEFMAELSRVLAAIAAVGAKLLETRVWGGKPGEPTPVTVAVAKPARASSGTVRKTA